MTESEPEPEPEPVKQKKERTPAQIEATNKMRLKLQEKRENNKRLK